MTQKTKRILIGIIGISVLLRLATAFYLGNQVEVLPGTFDQISYHTLAIRFLGGHGFTFGEPWWPLTAADAPTAHWSYLYTIYLIIVYSIFGPNPLVARIIQALVVGILTPLITFKLGRYLFTNTVGLVAAGICAVYIYFVYYASTLMTEAFYILAILASLFFAMMLVESSRDVKTKQKLKYAISMGITLGIAVLLRQLILLFIPFLFLWVWWSGRNKEAKSLIPTLILTGIVVVGMVIPFTIFNYIRFDRFVLLNTNAGFAFFWGNHTIYGTHFEPILPPEMGTYQDLIPEELRHLDEVDLEKALLVRGIQFIIDDPERYILLSISRIPPYFVFWPSPESGLISNISRVFSFGITWPFMLFGLVYAPFSSLLQKKFKLDAPLMLLYSFIVIYATIHFLTWTLIRYRLPIDAVLVIFAALTIIHITQFIQNKFGSAMITPNRQRTDH